MKGFKDSTRTKYMCGGPVKKFDGGGVFNERGQRATWDEVAAEGRRVEGRKRPVEGISTRPTDKYGNRATDADLGIARPVAKKPMPKPLAGAAAGAAAGALAGAGARAGARVAGKAVPRGVGAISDRDVQMAREAMKKAVPAHSSNPIVRRNKGGLMAMPKGKCK